MLNCTTKMKIFLLLIWVSLQLQITPLEAGTIVVEDKLIRLNTCISKKVDLKLRKEYFQSHNNIQVIAVMSGLKMNDQLAFQFYHRLVCDKLNCQFHLSLQRFTPIVSPFFSYRITIDFLIAHGLRTKDFNMTYTHQNFKIPNFEQETKISKIMKQDDKNEEWIVYPLLYGFSDVKLTAYVQVQKIEHSDNFVIKYVSDKKDNWANNERFVLYKIVFLPKSYFKDNNAQKSFFIGLKSVTNNQIQYEFYSTQYSKADIKVESLQNGLQILKIPISETPLFNDNRRHPMFTQIAIEQSKNVTQSNNSASAIYWVVVLLILELLYIFYKQNIRSKPETKQTTKPELLPQLIISFHQYSANSIQQQTKSVLTRNDTEKDIGASKNEGL